MPSEEIANVYCTTGYYWDKDKALCVLTGAIDLTSFLKPQCPSGTTYDSSLKVCVQDKPVPGAVVLSCSEKVAAIKCEGLDISCAIDKTMKQTGCIFENILKLSLLAFAGIVILAIVLIAALARRRKR